MADYDVKLYRGCPETSGDTLEEMLEKGYLEPVAPAENGNYDLCPGIYSCHMTGSGIYPTLKVFSIKEVSNDFRLDELAEKNVAFLRMNGEAPQGYQPTTVVPDVPEFFKRTQKDELLCIWPDEILELYADSTVPKHHQCMNQEELERVLGALECRYLQDYTIGTSQHYKFSIPMMILSKESLADGWQEVLQRLSVSKKLNILYQAQIHGNEPAACDGALEVLKAFCGDTSLQALLDHINLVVVPRVNPEAAYLYRRMAYDNIDLNRDHMACDAYETRLLHQVFQMLEPEVVLDGHEFTFFVTEREADRVFVAKGAEIMSSPATSLNIDEAVRACSFDVCGRVFEEMKEKGYLISHFGTSEKSSLGRGFYGLNQCLSFLIETRGIGGGRYGYDKRVFAQKDIMIAYIRNAASSAEEIKKIVESGRQNAAYISELVLHHGSSEAVFTPYKGFSQQYHLDGSLHAESEAGLILNDAALRSRSSGAGYIMPADAAEIETIIEKVKTLGCQVTELEAGIRLMTRQYVCMGLREEDAHEKDITAELMPAEEVIFDAGAFLFAADDFRAVPLAMLMEPDVTDTVGTKGTLFQQGLLDYDEETGLFPLYRMIEV